MFYFGSNEESSIGTHVIKRFEKQLLPKIQGDMIDITCCLDSEPAKMYKIKLRVEESSAFDILLGKDWKGDRLGQAQSSNNSTSQTRKESPGNKLGLSLTPDTDS
jgi:hypothetical protein